MIDTKKTGIGFYVNYLVRALAETHRVDLEGYYFDFLGRNKKVPPTILHTSFLPIKYIPGKILSLARRLKWQPPLEIFVQKRPDLVLFTNYVSLPLIRPTKVALVIYDLSFIDHPEFTETKNLAYLQSFCSESILKADLIITISDFTKERITAVFPEATTNIVVTPIPPFANDLPISDMILEKNSLKSGFYILYLGTLEPRKNITSLIEAYQLLPEATRSQFPLVLAGGKGWKDDSIHALIDKSRSSGNRIITTGYISDQDKASLYSHAGCFTLPSHYEGFGMPILEAMQYSIPIAVSDIPVFHEVAGDGALYFDKDNASSIAHTLNQTLTNKKTQQKLIQAQHEQLTKFSWQDNATAVLDAISKL